MERIGTSALHLLAQLPGLHRRRCTRGKAECREAGWAEIHIWEWSEMVSDSETGDS